MGNSWLIYHVRWYLLVLGSRNPWSLLCKDWRYGKQRSCRLCKTVSSRFCLSSADPCGILVVLLQPARSNQLSMPVTRRQIWKSQVALHRNLLLLHHYLNHLNVEGDVNPYRVTGLFCSLNCFWSLISVGAQGDLCWSSILLPSWGGFAAAPVVSASLAAPCLCLFIFSSHHCIRAVCWPFLQQ